MKERLLILKDSPVAVRNIVYLNLSKLPLFDDLYNTRQHFFLEEIRTRFGITDAKRNN